VDGGRLVILDTHAWIWWVSDPGKLSDHARTEIDGAASIGVCAISCWEVAMLVAKDRLRLDRDVLTWIRQALRQPRVRLIPLLPDIAVAAARMGNDVPADPADRMIAATARHLAAPLVTRDQALQAALAVDTIW
jgi:PIN domain nuclease of toxin-antitoxin system